MTEENKDDNSTKSLNMNTRLDCNTTVKFAQMYFDGSISYSIKDCVLEHLLVCQKCYTEYRKIAKELGLSFNLRNEAIQFAKDARVKNFNRLTKKTLEELGFANDIKCAINEWSAAANSFNLTKLMNLKAFSDFASEDFTVKLDNWDDDIESIHNFTKWFAKRIANAVDFLEHCYTLETTEVTLDEKNKKESEENEKS